MIDYISKDKHVGAMDINSLDFLVEQYLQQTNKVFGDSLRVTDQRFSKSVFLMLGQRFRFIYMTKSKTSIQFYFCVWYTCLDLYFSIMIMPIVELSYSRQP